MNPTQRRVETASNLAFLMVLMSAKLPKNSQEKFNWNQRFENALARHQIRTLDNKKVPPNAELFLMKQIIEEVGRLGSIHQIKTATSSH